MTTKLAPLSMYRVSGHSTLNIPHVLELEATSAAEAKDFFIDALERNGITIDPSRVTSITLGYTELWPGDIVMTPINIQARVIEVSGRGKYATVTVSENTPEHGLRVWTQSQLILHDRPEEGK